MLGFILYLIVVGIVAFAGMAALLVNISTRQAEAETTYVQVADIEDGTGRAARVACLVHDSWCHGPESSRGKERARLIPRNRGTRQL